MGVERAMLGKSENFVVATAFLTLPKNVVEVDRAVSAKTKNLVAKFVAPGIQGRQEVSTSSGFVDSEGDCGAISVFRGRLEVRSEGIR